VIAPGVQSNIGHTSNVRSHAECLRRHPINERSASTPDRCRRPGPPAAGRRIWPGPRQVLRRLGPVIRRTAPRSPSRPGSGRGSPHSRITGTRVRVPCRRSPAARCAPGGNTWARLLRGWMARSRPGGRARLQSFFACIAEFCSCFPFTPAQTLELSATTARSCLCCGSTIKIHQVLNYAEYV
jgi:hypothetical protein